MCKRSTSSVNAQADRDSHNSSDDDGNYIVSRIFKRLQFVGSVAASAKQYPNSASTETFTVFLLHCLSQLNGGRWMEFCDRPLEIFHRCSFEGRKGACTLLHTEDAFHVVRLLTSTICVFFVQAAFVQIQHFRHKCQLFKLLSTTLPGTVIQKQLSYF